jgi:hypothetical protein
MQRIGIAIEITWLMVRMAKRSSVATRRHINGVNSPWVKTHGYLQMSLRDICERVNMLHEKYCASPALLPGFQTVPITIRITMHRTKPFHQKEQPRAGSCPLRLVSVTFGQKR